MDDEEYARAMLAILTNPTPEGIDPNDPYGQAADGIDRHDGFGREVVVTSVTAVAGEHGTEFSAGFELVGAPVPVPPGELRLPGSAEWRELSGYADPAAYAPVVAHRVFSAARGHYLAHREPGSAERRAEARRQARAALPSRAEQWQTLKRELRDHLGEPVEVAPGRIEIREANLTVLVTPDQWEDVLVANGLDLVVYFADLLGPRDQDDRFVVFYQGDLARSTREELPPVPGRAAERRWARIRAENPGAQFSIRAFPPGHRGT